MRVPITSVAELGLVVRATRRAFDLRLDDAASSARVGAQFAGELERGKETVQLGKVIQLLNELGIQISVDIPPSAESELKALKEKGVPPLKPRKRSTSKVQS